jgi:hypothetical protein
MRKRGQSLIEYSVLIIILIAVFLAMNSYIKRGIQGRWKTTVDDFGDQYDPNTINGVTNYILTSSANTVVRAVPEATGIVTQRTDTTNTREDKIMNTTVK